MKREGKVHSRTLDNNQLVNRTPEYGIGTNTQILYELSQNLLFDILCCGLKYA